MHFQLICPVSNEIKNAERKSPFSPKRDTRFLFWPFGVYEAITLWFGGQTHGMNLFLDQMFTQESCEALTQMLLFGLRAAAFSWRSSRDCSYVWNWPISPSRDVIIGKQTKERNNEYWFQQIGELGKQRRMSEVTFVFPLLHARFCSNLICGYTAQHRNRTWLLDPRNSFLSFHFFRDGTFAVETMHFPSTRSKYRLQILQLLTPRQSEG